MKSDVFEEKVKEQIERSLNVLVSKEKEYVKGKDRLDHFKKTANILSISTNQAIVSMLMKHIVSIIDMVNSKETYTKELWNEKITDAINYLLILRAAQEDSE